MGGEGKRGSGGSVCPFLKKNQLKGGAGPGRWGQVLVFEDTSAEEGAVVGDAKRTTNYAVYKN